MTDHLSTLVLHRYRYGEIAGAEAAVVQSHLEGCASCAARLHHQERDRSAFEVAPVPEAIRALDNEPGWRSWLRGRFVAPVLVLVAAAAAGIVLWDPGTGPGAPSADEVRTKGSDAPLEVWTEGPSGVRAVGADEPLSAGQRVQLRYDPQGFGWSVIAGVDGSGAVEVYGQAEEDNGQTGPRHAPFSLVLDEAAGPQRFVLLLSQEPLSEAQIQAAARGEAVAGVVRHHVEHRKP